VVAFLVDIERRVQRRIARWSADDAPLAEVFASFLAYQFRLKRPYYKFVRVFLAQMFARTEQVYPYLVELQGIIDPPLTSLFESLQNRGILRADLPVEDLVLQFKTFHLGLTVTWAMEGPPWRGSGKALPNQVRLFCEGFEEKA
jgi:hypothetical protein